MRRVRVPTAFGSQIYASDDVTRSLRLLARAGAKYVRIGVQTPPAFLDALVSAATHYGLRVILISAYSSQPVKLDAYAQAAAQLHLRYAAANPVWEIWNEPNLAQYWNGPPDVNAYLAVLAATAPALRAVGATDVWTGGTSGVYLNWIYNLVRLGAFRYATGCAVHIARFTLGGRKARFGPDGGSSSGCPEGLPTLWNFGSIAPP